jgi:hypothetical protein
LKQIIIETRKNNLKGMGFENESILFIEEFGGVAEIIAIKQEF